MVVISYNENDNSLGGESRSLIPVDRSLIHHTQKQTHPKHTHKHNNSRDSKGWILISLRLWLPHLMKFNFCAVLGQSSYEGDNGEAIAIADLYHEAIRVVKEDLVHFDPSSFYYLPHILYFHFIKLLLHCCHTLALHFHN